MTRPAHPRHRRAGPSAIGVGEIALASSERPRATQEKPTVVLVHGGWADSSG
jgi:hypothetical protein